VKAITANSLFQTWCIYGPSGGGKTTLAATAPKPIFMDSNQGLLSIAGRSGFEHVRGEAIRNFPHLERAYTYCTGTGKKDWSKVNWVRLHQNVIADVTLIHLNNVIGASWLVD